MQIRIMCRNLAGELIELNMDSESPLSQLQSELAIRYSRDHPSEVQTLAVQIDLVTGNNAYINGVIEKDEPISALLADGAPTDEIELTYVVVKLTHGEHYFFSDDNVDCWRYGHVGKYLKSNFSVDVLGSKRVILSAVRQNRYALQFASEELRADRKVVLTAVRKNGLALQYASERLRADREVVLAAVRQNWFTFTGYHARLQAIPNWDPFCWCPLQVASAELRADREVVLAAVRQDGSALQYASDALRADREFMLAAVRQDGSALHYASVELRNDREMVLAAVRQTGNALQFASEELHADRDFVLAAVSVCAPALAYASEELRADREVVLTAVRKSSFALEYASEELRADREVFLTAVIAPSSGELTIMGLTGASVGIIGLGLVNACVATGLAASFVFGVSVALIALGSLLSLVAGSYYLRQRAPAVKKSISDTLNYFGFLRPHRQQSAQRDTSRVASFGASS